MTSSLTPGKQLSSSGLEERVGPFKDKATWQHRARERKGDRWERLLKTCSRTRVPPARNTSQAQGPSCLRNRRVTLGPGCEGAAAPPRSPPALAAGNHPLPCSWLAPSRCGTDTGCEPTVCRGGPRASNLGQHPCRQGPALRNPLFLDTGPPHPRELTAWEDSWKGNKWATPVISAPWVAALGHVGRRGH